MAVADNNKYVTQSGLEDLLKDYQEILCCKKDYARNILESYFEKLKIDGFVDEKNVYALLSYLAADDLLKNSGECLTPQMYSILKEVELFLRGSYCLLPLANNCK